MSRPLSTALTQLQANRAIGIRSSESKDDTSLPMFSDDILKVEISGPDVCRLGRHNTPLDRQALDLLTM